MEKLKYETLQLYCKAKNIDKPEETNNEQQIMKLSAKDHRGMIEIMKLVEK